MIKAIIATVVLVSGAYGFECAAQKSKMPEIVLPREMAANVAEQNKAAAEKGYALYQLTCAQCHGGKLKGSNAIPDFTVDQLEAYQIRIANATHEVRLNDKALTSEELALITTFFMYKKPTGKPFKPKSSNISSQH